jgi:hypothetical protein
MTAVIRLFVAVFITTLLVGAARANDDLPPQGGPLKQVPKAQPPRVYPPLTNGEWKRMKLASPVTVRIEFAATGRLQRVTVVSGPKDPEFQQLMTRLMEENPPPPGILDSNRQTTLHFR